MEVGARTILIVTAVALYYLVAFSSLWAFLLTVATLTALAWLYKLIPTDCGEESMRCVECTEEPVVRACSGPCVMLKDTYIATLRFLRALFRGPPSPPIIDV